MSNRILEYELFGKWTEELTEEEMYVYMRGTIGSAISEHVVLDNEDVEMIGGKEELDKILKNIVNKAEKLKPYAKTYNNILITEKRVREKFLK